jgi:hypothetical protein
MIIVGMVVRHTRKNKRVSRRKRLRKRLDRVYIGGQGKERCIFTEMIPHEGLGNQLFIFAAGLVVQQKTGLPLCVVPSSNNPHTDNDYRLLFKTPSKVEIVEEANARPRINAANSILDVKSHYMTGAWSNADITYNSTSIKNAKIPGRLYQNYSAIEKVIPVVKETLMTNEFSKKDIYRELERGTDSATSAFLHVRRGDYKDRGWSLDDDYYLRGLDILEADANIKTVWIISNDLDWCKTINWAGRTTKQIEFYDSDNELEVLYKMLLCQAGAVVSPSTFSAWGAMLGADMNPKSTIVYPLSWLIHDGAGTNPMMLPPRWTAIANTVGTTTTLI